MFLLSLLHMRDYALIDNLALEFHEGLNVLSGETGAGKSILIGAIDLMLGERSSGEQIRTGAEEALVEAVFHCLEDNQKIKELLADYGISFADELVLSRKISRHGRNICRINGRPVPLAALKAIGELLVDLHGQHSQHSLLHTEQHLFLLDEFGGPALIQKRNQYREAYKELQQLRHRLKSLGENARERERNLDLLRFQLDEILAAALDEKEEEELKQRLLLLDNMEKLLNMANNVYGELYEGMHENTSVVDRLNSIIAELDMLQHIDPKLASFLSLLEEASTSLSELSHELYAYREHLTFYPEERNEIEERLEVYSKIKRKYGSSVEEVLAFADKCKDEINLLENNEEEALQLETEEKKQLEKVERLAAQLHSLRQKAASKLEVDILTALKELGMPDAQFSVSLQKKNVADATGSEEVEFLFSSNPGEPVKSISRIISAGEMARVMLAVKSILAAQDQIPTLIFDEIDSGVGGITVQKVAQKMAKLGLKHQVICVTHSSQIASAANHHFYIYKEVCDGRTCTRIKYLEDDSRITEIARLLDGRSDDEVSRQHAAALLTQNQSYHTR